MTIFWPGMNCVYAGLAAFAAFRASSVTSYFLATLIGMSPASTTCSPGAQLSPASGIVDAGAVVSAAAASPPAAAGAAATVVSGVAAATVPPGGILITVPGNG